MDEILRAFGRHLDRCNNAALPGHRARLRLGTTPIGFVAPELLGRVPLADLLRPEADGFSVADARALDAAGRRVAEAGLARWRGEAFDVRAADDALLEGPVLATLDRGVLPDFGIAATGVHLNGIVERDGEVSLWVARRAADKLLDPGKLDHLAAGGVPAGLTPAETMVKEAEEECGLPPRLAAGIRPVGIVRYAAERDEGLRRDVLRCYDVSLPADWEPEAVDGEVAGFELWPLARVLEAVREGDAFKFNVNLVLIDLFLRRGLIDPASGTGRALRRGLAGDWLPTGQGA